MSTTTLMTDLRLALDPVHDTQAVFRVLLEAMARPAQPRQIPVAALDAPSNAWVASALLTLLDHETSFATVSNDGLDWFVRARTNARYALVGEADFVLVDSPLLTPGLIRDLKRGSLAYPDESATLVISVVHDAPARVLRLRGPGIDGRREMRLPLPPLVVEALVEANTNYPCGIDLYLIDTTGRVSGLPRSTRLAEA
jgi:alpha-D-ribose 1-methylphosphonate 5-triphosphate synthase subunit PhnH